MKTYEPDLSGGGKLKEERKRRVMVFEPTRSILEFSAAAGQWEKVLIALIQNEPNGSPWTHYVRLLRVRD